MPPTDLMSTAAARAKQAAKAAGQRVARRRPRRVDLPLAHWGLSIGPSGHLQLGDVDLVSIAEQFGTPLHVVDADRLGAAADAALAPHRAGTGADIFYSYKTNPVPSVLSRLHMRGIGAEVISEYELWLALRLGVPGQRIIYNGPAKSDASIRTAARAGVLLVNANSLTEMERIAGIARSEDATIDVGLRVSLPGMWGGQFGIDGASDDVVTAVRLAQASSHLRLRGLHVHRGGTMRGEDEWRAHVAATLSYTRALRDRTGWQPEILDLGGSLACPSSAAVPTAEFRFNRAYGTDLLPPDPSTAISLARASSIAHEMATAFADGRPVPRLVQEPGRSLTADTQLLLLSVVDVKRDVCPPHAVLDGGRNLCDPLPHEYHHILSADAPSEPHVVDHRLVGPICTPADVLAYGWRLPRLERGHVLAIMDTGAYFVPFSTAFSFPRAAIAVVDGSGVTLQRAHETFDDLVRNDERT